LGGLRLELFGRFRSAFHYSTEKSLRELSNSSSLAKNYWEV